MLNILITRLTYYASIDAIKLLKKITWENIKIIGSSRHSYGYSSGSHMVDIFLSQPDLESEEEFLSFIKHTCKTYNIDILFSFDEDELKVISKNISQLNVKCICPDYSTIDLFCNKRIANIAMENLNINIPRTFTGMEKIPSIHSKKVIIRECVSCGSRGIECIDVTPTLCIKSLIKPSNIVQEVIEGMEYCVDIFCDSNGNVKLIVPRDRIAIREGTTHKCTLKRDERLIALCKKICRYYKLPGFSNIQFIVENKTNRIFFIELNPRMGAATISTCLGSINLMELLIRHFYYNEKLESFNYYMNKVRWNAFIARYYEETILDYE